MPEYYAFCRNLVNRRRFIRMIVIYDIGQFFAGAGIYYLYYMMDKAGFVSNDGKVYGLFTYGVYMTVVVVLSHHIQVALNTRNWTLYLAFWATFSICMLPFTLWLANAFTYKAYMYKATYS